MRNEFAAYQALADTTTPKREERSPLDLLLSFWQQAHERHDAPRAVYALLRHADGAIVTWSVSRRAIERAQSNQWEPAAHSIVRMQPTN